MVRTMASSLEKAGRTQVVLYPVPRVLAASGWPGVEPEMNCPFKTKGVVSRMVRKALSSHLASLAKDIPCGALGGAVCTYLSVGSVPLWGPPCLGC